MREKYLRTTNFESQAELQKFLSELYVFLIDEMHKGLAKVLTLEDQTPVPEPLTDSDQLKHFARESEVNNNMTLAGQFYLEVSLWFPQSLLDCINTWYYMLTNVYLSESRGTRRSRPIGLTMLVSICSTGTSPKLSSVPRSAWLSIRKI